MTKKTCFLVTPIGPNDSDIRRRVDQWFEHIYSPVFKRDYHIVRADKINKTGSITAQILDYLLNADLVIIDYTGFNPNVMYEAAVRHLVKKPFIHISLIGEKIPFDIKDLMPITYDPFDINYPKKLKKNLKECMQYIESEKYEQPEILKTKIDLDRILSDPEKFVDLLKNKLLNNPLTTDNLSINPSIESFSRYRYTYSSDPDIYLITCPHCGHSGQAKEWEKKSIPEYPTNGILTLYKFLYKCPHCTKEFEYYK